MGAPGRTFEHWLRARAYDVLSLRDGQHGWRRGRRDFEADSRLKLADLRKVSEQRLAAMLQHAFRSTPYYRALWSEMGFRPGTSVTSADLMALPFLTKDILRAQKQMMLSTQFRPDQLRLSYTGGTTGTQTAFYLDRACAARRLGRQWGAMESCGYTPGIRRALVWGVHSDITEPGAVRSLKQRFREYASADSVLCCTVMDDAIMRKYHAQLVRFRPDVLYGYPSALAQLGRFIEEWNLEPIRVRTVMTTAERLTHLNRAALSRIFGGEVFNLYCTREHGCIAHECAHHRGMHVDTGSLFVEITKDGQRVAPGAVGEITITDLMNQGMPFIRSRTGDLGSLSPEPCSCSSPFPLLQSLDGRDTDVIRKPDGSFLAGLMLADLFMDMPQIRYAQFVQRRIDLLEVLVIVTPEFSAQHEQRALQEVRSLIGEQLSINLRRVDDLPRNPRSGKIREVVSLLSPSGAK